MEEIKLDLFCGWDGLVGKWGILRTGSVTKFLERQGGGPSRKIGGVTRLQRNQQNRNTGKREIKREKGKGGTRINEKDPKPNAIGRLRGRRRN